MGWVRDKLIQATSNTNWCVDGTISNIGVVAAAMGWSHLRGVESSQIRGRNWVKAVEFLLFVLLGFVIDLLWLFLFRQCP